MIFGYFCVHLLKTITMIIDTNKPKYTGFKCKKNRKKVKSKLSNRKRKELRLKKKKALAKKKRNLAKYKLKQAHWWKAYREYLQSEKWRELREIILERDSHKCIECGSDYRLEVHHLTYRNMGNENFDELITLCKSCHDEIHKNNNNFLKYSE